MRTKRPLQFVLKGSSKQWLQPFYICHEVPPPHDNIHTEDVTSPLARHTKSFIASSLGADNPHINASAARKAAQQSKIAADKKAAEEMRRASKIQEINCRQSELAKLEAQYSTNHEMGNCKEELASSRSAK